MFKIIRTARFNELNQQLDGLRSTNAEKSERINVLEGYVSSIERERDAYKDKRFEFESENTKLVAQLELSKGEYDRQLGVLKDSNELAHRKFSEVSNQLGASKQQIEELQAQAKIQNGKALKDKETIFELRGKIEKLEAEVARHKNEASEQRELRQAVMKPVDAVNVPAEETAEVELKDGMWVEAPEGCESYLTPGKAYQVSKVEKTYKNTYFYLVNDNDSTSFTTLLKSAHLKFQDWKIVSAPAQDVPLEAEVVPTPLPAPQPDEIPNATKAVELPAVDFAPEPNEIQSVTAPAPAKRTYNKRIPKNRKRK